MTKPLQGSHLRKSCNLLMGVASIMKAKNPSTSKSTVIKRDNSFKVGLLKGNETARKLVSSSSVKMMAQQVCHTSVLGLYTILDWYGRYVHTCTFVH
jgi:hypothetical protein